MTNETQTDRLAEVLERADNDWPSHNLVATLARHLRSVSTDLDKAQQRIAELEGALISSKQGWDNVLEFRLIADNHRGTARFLSDEAFIALNPPKESDR